MADARAHDRGPTIAAERTDFTMHGILTIVLAFIAWPAGLVVGLFSKAKINDERSRLGHEPQGKALVNAGLLLNWVLAILTLLAVIALVVMFVLGISLI